jgi:hypothetical protein
MNSSMRGGTNREWDLFMKLSIVGFMIGVVFIILKVEL